MLWKPRRSDEDFREEIRAHLELEMERLIASGMSPAEARDAAQRNFGNRTRVQEQFYEARRVLWLDHALLDLKTACRSITRYPLAAGVAIISLAAGIGAATITLTMRDVIFHNPPPLYVAPEQLSVIHAVTIDRSRGRVAAGLYRQWSADRSAGYALAAATGAAARDVRVGERLETVNVRGVAPETFSILGVSPVVGRTFDGAPQAAQREAILSYRAWQTLLDGRADPVGQTIWIDGQPHTIVGVMPRQFWFLSMNVAIWTPLDARELPATGSIDVVARRRASVSPEALQQQLQASAGPYLATLPPDQQRVRVYVGGIGGTPLGNAIGPIPVILLAMSVLLTLLIACTNVAILMISQWTAREHEIAIRASIGASRGRLVRTLVTESVVIALAGGVLGVLTTLGLRALMSSTGEEAAMLDLSIRPAIFVQSAVIAVVAGILTGLAPALYETRRSQRNPLRQIRSSDRVRQRWRHALVGIEIAVTVALLVVASALVSGYRRTLAYEPGFEPRALISVGVENAGGVQVNEIGALLSRMDGIAAVSAASALPFTGPFGQQRVAADAQGSGAIDAAAANVAHDYFSTLGVSMRAGRPFTADEAQSSSRLAVVNEQLAAQLWPGRTAVGAQLWINNTVHEVIGVVSDYANAPLRPARPAVFVPLGPASQVRTSMRFLVRASGNPGMLVDPIRREIQALSSDDVVSQSTPLSVIQSIGAQEILVSTLPMAPLIAIGLLLTAAGIYGVLAFAVARRSNELAVRVAVGARGLDLIALVMSQSARLVAAGLIGGVGATFALTRVAQGSGGIFDSPGWQAFVVPAAIVIVVAVMATWIPCRRAIRIDPSTLLRTT